MIFEIFFAIAFITVVFFIIYSVIKGLKLQKEMGRKFQQETIQPVIKEKEIIKEIVKIRCPYCNNLYDEKEDKCPHCGGVKAV
jgi:rubrerythrin